MLKAPLGAEAGGEEREVGILAQGENRQQQHLWDSQAGRPAGRLWTDGEKRRALTLRVCRPHVLVAQPAMEGMGG